MNEKQELTELQQKNDELQKKNDELQKKNDELQKKNDELQKKNDELQKINSRLQEFQELQELQESKELQESLNKLNERYNCLEEEYIKLKGEYSENIIIQSMNEMKTRYDIMIKTTVPSYKFTLLNEKYNKLVKNCVGSSVLIDYIIKLIHKSERDIMNRRDILLKAELELITVKEILEIN